MEILANETDWTANDSEQLARFLDTETGKRVIPQLVSHSPGLMPGGDINAILIRSGEVRAFQQVIEVLLTLAHPVKPPPPPATSYPPPEDDRFWNDGNKLNPVNATGTEPNKQ